jgi:hypothetical protein
VTLAAANRDSWVRSSSVDWAAESLSLRSFVYSFTQPLTADYLAAGRAHVERRLAQSGLRLAALLNRSFCPGVESR